MSDLELSVPSFNLMLALVHLRGPATTADFDAEFGFGKVETRAQRELVDNGLITIERAGRRNVFELTDSGWRTARMLLAGPAPKGISQRTARILWAVMGDFSAYMDRVGAELADVYPPRIGTDAETAIRAAYRELAESDADWIPLRELREHLDGIERDEVDKALTEMVASHSIRLIPESNQKTLTADDREAAIWLGGEYRHLIAIEAL